MRYYTPLNEPMVNALFCGRLGQWPPHLEGMDGYVKVLLGVCRGVALTEKALRAANPEAVIVQVEAVEYHHSSDSRLQRRIALEQEHIFLPFDLFTGRVGAGHMLLPFLQSHGVGEGELRWFQEHPIAVDIFGVNYYPVSGGAWLRVSEGAEASRVASPAPSLVDVLHMVWDRYRLPMMLTETAVVGSLAERMPMDGRIGGAGATRRTTPASPCSVIPGGRCST